MPIDLERTKLLCERIGIADLPLGIFYTDHAPSDAISPESGYVPRDEDFKDPEFDLDGMRRIYPCVMAYARRVRRSGVTAFFDAEHYGCFGAGFYLGFKEMSPLTPYYVSTGKKGEFEGERYVKSPEVFMRRVEKVGVLKAPAKYCVFKRVDKLAEDETPSVIAFFINPDQTAGLAGLINFAMESHDSVISPFGAACATLILHPLKQAAEENPKAILGGFDISARPFFEPDYMSLAMPLKLFERILNDMDEAFLATESWRRVLKRIHLTQKKAGRK